MAMTQALYYKHSGRFSVPGAALGLVGGIAGGLLWAAIYAYLILYVPFIYFRLIFTALYGLVIAWETAKLLKIGKVRNTTVSLLVLVAVTLVSFYFSWAVWVFALLRRANTDASLLTIVRSPDVLWALVGEINRVGAWSLRGGAVKGTFLWVIWVSEAAIVGGLSVIAGMGLAMTPFCEKCGVWCVVKEGVGTRAEGDPAELKRRLEAKDLGYVESLPAVAPDAARWFRFDIEVCPGCGGTNTLGVKQVSLKVDKRGKATQKNASLFGGLLVTKDEAERVCRLATPPPGAGAAVATLPISGGPPPA